MTRNRDERDQLRIVLSRNTTREQDERVSRTEKILRRWPWWVVLVLAVTLLVIGVPAYQQWRAIDWIEQNGGMIRTEPGWLRKMIPDTLTAVLDRKYRECWSLPFDRVVWVALSIDWSREVPSGELQRMRSLIHLEHLVGLHLESREDLKCLENFPKLKTLDIEADFSEESLRFLKDKLRLKELDVYGELTDSHFRVLAEMENLDRLTIASGAVTDDGLKHLRGLTTLVELRVVNEEVSDAGLVHFSTLKNLTTLSLPETSVTDEGLRHLQGLTSLEVLNLDDTAVSSKGVMQLKGLSDLKQLWIRDTNVKKSEMDQLRKNFPTTTIFHYVEGNDEP